MDTDAYFSPTYQTARKRFLDAARRCGARLEALGLDAKGPGGEDLTIDIAWFGAPTPKRALVHSSGLHGVEAFAGSAIQIQLLEGLPPIPEDAALVLTHVLNPYGMAWLRRSNENNVDLNRNFLPREEVYSGHPPGYEDLNEFLNPYHLPFLDFFFLRAGWLLLRHGMPKLKRSVVVGQYDYPMGLFFGGKELQQGAGLYQDFLASTLGRAETVSAIDVHTGLGPFGRDTLLVSPDSYPRMRELLGERVQPFRAEEGSVAYPVLGGLHDMIPRLLGNARVDFTGQEFGTYSGIRILGALRNENHAYHHGIREVDAPSRQALKAAFCPNHRGWKQAVLERGRELFDQMWGLRMSVP